jgi:phosphohistidine phosphatase
MQRLILMRHAKTEPWAEGMDDFGRALLPRGHEDAGLMAKALAEAGWIPEQILISPSRRTRETAAHVCAVFTGERVRAVEALYLAGIADIEAALGAATAECVMIIGHNPGLHDYALLLTEKGGADYLPDRARLIEKFPTSCAAVFERAQAEEGGALKLAGVLRAAELRAPD